MLSSLSLLPRFLGYELYRSYGFPRQLPLSYTFSTTFHCDCRCKTCDVWKPSKRQELELPEWEKIFKSLGKAPYWVTLTGGNQFLRKDLVELVEALISYCRPAIINIPTSGSRPALVEENMRRIVELCRQNGSTVINNISLDGILEKQDDMRGNKNNFKNTLETYRRLKEIKKGYSRHFVGFYTIVSSYNIDDLPAITSYVLDELKPDDYSIEIAEERQELKNTERRFVPETERFISALTAFESAKKKKSDGIIRLRDAIRTHYFKVLTKSMRERREVFPCYAGIASAQTSAYGDVWECCTRADVMGNLRDYDYDYKKLFFSSRAEAVRKKVQEEKCYCTHGNPAYTSMMCDFSSRFQIAKHLLFK